MNDKGAVIACAFLAACNSDLLTLGRQAVNPESFDPPHRVGELVATGFRNDNPSLTGDLLEIYFTSDRSGDWDVWMAQRASRTDVFRAPTRVDAASSSSRETSSAVSQDGLTLWFASDRPGGSGDLDVWAISRPDRNSDWSAPKNVASLNSSTRDLPRPVGRHDLAMPMASDRGNGGVYRTMLATRPTVTSEFTTPVPLADLSSFSVSVDGCLTDDDLSLFFVSGDVGDLYVAPRLAASDPFPPPIPLVQLNTTSAERDPWMSPDRTAFYFSSDRDGSIQIYATTVHPRTP